jgi:anti-sigma B factor antagonist
MEMSIEELDGGVTLTTLRGRLDVAGAGQIDLKFNATAGARKALIVDLSGVSFIASMGMRLLLIAGRTVAAKGGKMVLLAPTADVDAVLRTARIDGVMPICTARAAALAAVSPT